MNNPTIRKENIFTTVYGLKNFRVEGLCRYPDEAHAENIAVWEDVAGTAIALGAGPG